MVTADLIGHFVGYCVVYFQSIGSTTYDAIKNKEYRMSIARVAMHEFNEENMHEEVEAIYETIVDEYFPNLKQVINIKTGPTSGISIALYPSFENAETNLKGRSKMIKLMEPYLKDSFYHEGEVLMNDLKLNNEYGTLNTIKYSQNNKSDGFGYRLYTGPRL